MQRGGRAGGEGGGGGGVGKGSAFGRSVPEVVGSNPTGAKFSLVRGDAQISFKTVATQRDLVYR